MVTWHQESRRMIHEEHLTMTCATQRINNNIYHSRLNAARTEWRTRWRIVGWIKRTSKGSAWRARDKMPIWETERIWKITSCHDREPLIRCHHSKSTHAVARTDTRTTRMGGTTPTVDQQDPAIQDRIILRYENRDSTTEETTVTIRCFKIVVDCCRTRISRKEMVFW